MLVSSVLLIGSISRRTKKARPSTTSPKSFPISSTPSRRTPLVSSRFFLPPVIPTPAPVLLCRRFLNALMRSSLGNCPSDSPSASPLAVRSDAVGLGEWARVMRYVSRLPAVAYIINTCRAVIGAPKLSTQLHYAVDTYLENWVVSTHE